MTTNQMMFIFAAEELNFTKAAKRAYVSQQCLSNHIARLEKEYGIKLFNRKSRSLELTWAGRQLYLALMHIKKIEDNVAIDIISQDANLHATITVGMPSSRASLIVSPMIAAYNRLYPNIRVDFVLRKTADLLGMLEASKIDFMIGIDVNPNENIEEVVLTHERCLLYISEVMTKRFLLGLNPSPATTLSADVFQKLPFSGMPDDSRLKLKLMNYLSEKSIPIKELCTVDNYTTLLMLAKNHVNAFIGSECVLWSDFFQILRRGNSHDKIFAFPIEGFNSTMKISLVYAKNTLLPVHTKKLINLTRDLYQKDAYLNYLSSYN